MQSGFFSQKPGHKSHSSDLKGLPTPISIHTFTEMTIWSSLGTQVLLKPNIIQNISKPRQTLGKVTVTRLLGNGHKKTRCLLLIDTKCS